LVMNDTRVLPARLFGKRSLTGGSIETLFLEEIGPAHWTILLRAGGRVLPGEILDLDADGARLELAAALGRGRWSVRLIDRAGQPIVDVKGFLERHGKMPLPPYIRRKEIDESIVRADRERYQTVFAERSGAVAAPTAGLHFTPEFLSELASAGIERSVVTLHVGIGTFQPVEVESLADHTMHEEVFEVPATTASAVARTRAAKGRVIAVGTTSLRSLESAWSEKDDAVQPTSGRTRIFLRPPRPVRSIDGLLTNFHLPKSTLLMLVAALIGRERLLDIYREAVAEKYRFFSYGDAMLVL
jgi:S-adenosylmethionine:tRNA ribosyltransferase-isomerase